MAAPPIPPSLGKPVSTRTFSLNEMVSRAWGSEFKAPDHRIYVFGNGARAFDSTDIGVTGIYMHGFKPWTFDDASITMGTPADTFDGGRGA